LQNLFAKRLKIYGNITNYLTKPIRRIDLVIGVSYNANLADTKAILTKIANDYPLVLKDEDITIGVSKLADSSVNLVIRPWVKTENYWPVYFELLETIKTELDNAGIEIPFPQLSVHVNQEN
jgi:small conductance mechanosensitive channel